MHDSGSAAADWARSGVVALTGHADGPPLLPPGRAASHAGELAEVITEATAGRVRLDGPGLLSERAALTGHTRHGRVSAGGRCRLLRTADGWAAVSCARPGDPALLGALVGAELPADPWPAIAAWLREHPGAELADRAELLGVAAAPIAPPTRAPIPAPGPHRWAAGLRVVDFSALWAGPLCAHLLGLAGADVIKVETPGRPDGARRGHPGFYRLLHAGHRSVVLDPAEPGGRRAMAALVDTADVVIEASRPRALAGFGDDVAASAGLVALDDRGEPVFCGDAIADPLTGLTAAALALTSPPGILLDLAMTDIIAATLNGPITSAARHTADGWILDTSDGPVPVVPPRPRPARGEATVGSADTAAVLAEIGGPAQ